jgi:phosphohistidine phosphatase SixA
MYVLDRFNALINWKNQSIYGSQNDNYKFKEYDDLNFFNGCILYLRIDVGILGFVGERVISLEMIHQGDILPSTPKLEKYFNIDSFTPISKMSVDDAILKRFFDIDISSLNPNIVYNIFFVRHGDAEHNTKYELIRVAGKAVKIPNSKINTNLTPLGIQQTTNSGRIFTEWALANYQKYGITRIDYGCVSDLVRTQQTAANFFIGIQQQNPRKVEEYRARQELNLSRNYQSKVLGLSSFLVNIDNAVIVVLPCLHELESGSPDGSITVMQGVGRVASAVTTLGAASSFSSRENQTNCRDVTGRGFKKRPYELLGYTVQDCSTLKQLGIPIDWTFYNSFYKGYRDQTTFGGRDSCRGSTHFLGIFFNLYLRQRTQLDNQFQSPVRVKPQFNNGLPEPDNPMELLVPFPKKPFQPKINRSNAEYTAFQEPTISDESGDRFGSEYDNGHVLENALQSRIKPQTTVQSPHRWRSLFSRKGRGGNYNKKLNRKSRKVNKSKYTRKNQRKQRNKKTQ